MVAADGLPFLIGGSGGIVVKIRYHDIFRIISIGIR